MTQKILFIFILILFTGCINNSNLDLNSFSQKNNKGTLSQAYNYYYGSDGYPVDYEKSFELFQKLYNNGHRKHVLNALGWFYYTGRGVNQNIEKAIELFEEAANENVIAAQYNLAWIYKNGIGVKKDKKTSDYWYEKAQSQGQIKINEDYELSYRHDKTDLLKDGLYNRFFLKHTDQKNNAIEYFNKLYWADVSSPKEVTTYDESKEYCSNLDIFRNSQWRLPTFDEIKMSESNRKIFKKTGEYFASNNSYRYVDANNGSRKDYVLCVSEWAELPSKKIFKNPFQKIASIVNRRTKKYLQPTELIQSINKSNLPNKPNLPSVYKIEKDVFETKAMFEKRIAKAKKIRKEQTKKILAEYRKKVEAYNKKIEEQKKILLYKKKHLPEIQRKFTIEAFKEVMIAPTLKPIYVNNQPKYDAENGYLYLALGMKGAKYHKEVKVKVSAGEDARNLFNSIKNEHYDVKVNYLFQNNNEIAIDNITVFKDEKKYLAKVDTKNDYKSAKPIQIVLKSIHIDEKSLDKQFKLLNPNIKDVEFETYIVQEQKAFNDDIPNILANTVPAKIDKSKWLFIIGIENYSQTDNINFSKRSAELFKQVAKKTLGIQERNIYTLIDNGATSASIKDRMKLMLRNVKKGDKIYFYYSGHGIPVVPAREPYILPSDKIPDFVSDDSFFKVKNIYKLLADSKASQVIVFMDSCFTGQTDGKSVFGTSKASSRLSPKSVSFNKNKMAIITAGTKNQFSNVYLKRGNRLFSYYLMKSLLQGKRNVNTLYKDVSVKVEEASYKMGDMNLQQPVFSGNGKLKL